MGSVRRHYNDLVYVRWKKRRRTGVGEGRRYTLWTAQLVIATRNRDNQPRQQIMATLGSFDPDGPQAAHPVTRLMFWNQADKRLAALQPTRGERKAIEAKLAVVVPRPTRIEVRGIAPDVLGRLEEHATTVVPNMTAEWRRLNRFKIPAVVVPTAVLSTIQA